MVTVAEFLHRLSRMRRFPRNWAIGAERLICPEILRQRDEYVQATGGWRFMADGHFDWLLTCLRNSPGSGVLPDEQVQLYLATFLGLQSSRSHRLRVSWN
jgi:hypothetical protein